MNFEKLINRAKEQGIINDPKMVAAVSAMTPMLTLLAKEHPDEYNKFVRTQYETMYGRHYNEEFAKEDADNLVYTNRQGEQRQGAHWTRDQVLDATKRFTFSPEVTEWDKYVAFNAFFADTNQDLEDELVLKAAYRFYFCDQDWPSKNTKIWDCMTMRSQLVS